MIFLIEKNCREQEYRNVWGFLVFVHAIFCVILVVLPSICRRQWFECRRTKSTCRQKKCGGRHQQGLRRAGLCREDCSTEISFEFEQPSLTERLLPWPHPGRQLPRGVSVARLVSSRKLGRKGFERGEPFQVPSESVSPRPAAQIQEVSQVLVLNLHLRRG